MKADNLISDKVMDRGIVRLAAAAKGCGDVKVGLADRYVFRGFAYDCDISDLMMHKPRLKVGESEKSSSGDKDANPCGSNYTIHAKAPQTRKTFEVA